ACSAVRAAEPVCHVAREAPRTPPRRALHSYTPVLLLPSRPVVSSRGEAMEFDRQDLSWKARPDRRAPSRGAGRLIVALAFLAAAEANSGNAPEMARAGALQLVKQQNAKAIITDSSQDDIGVTMLNYDGDASHQLDVPIVCMACTSPSIDNPQAQDADPVKQAALRNGKGWNFRTTMSDAYQARMVVHMLVSAGQRGDVHGDGKFKLSIYASDDPYG